MMYELLAFWNASEDSLIKEKLQYNGEFPLMKEKDEYTCANRVIGIHIGCYQEEIDRLRYPLKLVSTTFNGTYEDCQSRSYRDPNQGFYDLSWKEVDEILEERRKWREYYNDNNK